MTLNDTVTLRSGTLPNATGTITDFPEGGRVKITPHRAPDMMIEVPETWLKQGPPSKWVVDLPGI